MSLPLEKLIGFGVASAIALWIGYVAIDRTYLTPVGALTDSIASLKQDNASLNNALDGWIPTKRRMQEFGQTLLAREFDQSEHRLRTTLQEIGKRTALSDVRVSSSAAKGERTPLAEAAMRGRAYREMRKATDFAVVRGSFSGVGSLGEVTLAVAYLESQPWLHRIERVTIEPQGRDKSRFSLDVGFAVIYAPDLCPADAGMPAIVAPSDGQIAVARAVAARNVFVPPAPVVVATPEPVPEPVVVTPPAPVLPPYDRWKVTGLLERRSAGQTLDFEVWMLNLDSKEQRILYRGDEVLGFVAEWVSGECGLFTFEGERVVIHQGQTLADHVPAESVDCPGIDGVPSKAGARTGEGDK